MNDRREYGTRGRPGRMCMHRTCDHAYEENCTGACEPDDPATALLREWYEQWARRPDMPSKMANGLHIRTALFLAASAPPVEDGLATVEAVLVDRIVDHPMWDGIDYTMEREAKIATFVAEAVAALAAAGLLAASAPVEDGGVSGEGEREHSIQCRMLDNDTDRCVCLDTLFVGDTVVEVRHLDARTAIERVRALADSWDGPRLDGSQDWHARELRAALSGTEGEA